MKTPFVPTFKQISDTCIRHIFVAALFGHTDGDLPEEVNDMCAHPEKYKLGVPEPLYNELRDLDHLKLFGLRVVKGHAAKEEFRVRQATGEYIRSFTLYTEDIGDDPIGDAYTMVQGLDKPHSSEKVKAGNVGEPQAFNHTRAMHDDKWPPFPSTDRMVNEPPFTPHTDMAEEATTNFRGTYTPPFSPQGGKPTDSKYPAATEGGE